MTNPIVVVDYDPQWPVAFATICTTLETPPDSIGQNTYVIVDGCLSLRNHIGLRDVLRGDPELRNEYSLVKRRLAAATAVAELDEIETGNPL